MKRKHVIVFLIIMILALFAGFVTWRETSARAGVQRQLASHVNAVAHALWQLDAGSINDYLALAVNSGGYKQLTVYREDDVVFSRHQGEATDWLDEGLMWLGLLTDVTFQSPISYAGEPIGRIEVIWRSRTIYSEIYFLLALSLLGFLVERHFRVLEGRTVLESRVARRTRQLSSANTALRLSEERLRMAVDGGNVGIWEWDIVTDSLVWNDQLKVIFGLPEDAAGLSLKDFMRSLHPEDVSRVEASIQGALSAQTTFHTDYRIIRPDGAVRWIAARGHGHYDENGKPVSMAGVGLDITERTEAEHSNRKLLQESETSRRTLLSILEDQRRTEAELQKAEAIQRSIMESSIDTILLLDCEAAIRYINRGAPGVPMDRVIGTRVYDHVSMEFHSDMRACFERVLESGQPDMYQVEYQPPKGERIIYESRVAPVWTDGLVSGFAVIARDVTERRQTENALRASEERFRRAVVEAPFPILIHADDGEVLAVSRTWTEISGYEHAEIPTIADWTEKAYGSGKERVREDISGLYELATRKAEGEYRITCRDGSQRVWDFSSVSLGRLSDGRRTAISMAADVTERKQAEAELRQSFSTLEMFIDSLQGFVSFVDTQERYQLVNRYYEEWFEKKHDQIVGFTMSQVHRPETYAAMKAYVQRALSGERVQYESTLSARDGKEYCFDISYLPRRAPGGEVLGFFALIFDITERKRTEAERIVAHQRVDLLAGLVQRLMDTPTARDAARLILQTADDLLGWDACWLYLWHPEEGNFENIAAFDSVEGERREVTPNPESLERPTPTSRRVMEEGAQLLLRESEDESTTPLKIYGSNRRSLSLMFVPIQRKGELIGIISIQSYRAKAYDPVALDLLRALADHCASALYRIRTEESLRASEARLAAAQAHAHLGNWETETATQKRIWSTEMFRLLDRDPALGPASLDEFLAAVHPDDVERFRRGRARAIAACAPHHEEFRIVGPEGRVRWVETHAESIVDASGRLVRQVGTLQDITERKLAEEQIQHSGERLRRLSRRLIEVQETERRHLARELHDEIGQTLTAAKMHLQNLHLSPDSPAEHKRLADAIALVDGLLKTVRSLSLNLRPPMLDDLGLVPALRWLLDQHGRSTGQQVKFDHDDLEARLDPVIETTCFRIAQEAITNVIRHARAHEVHLQLRQEPGTLVLSVRDDGRGFDVDEAFGRASRGSSMGLVSMEERASLTGGHIKFASSRGNGTELIARFPLADRPLSHEPESA